MARIRMVGFSRYLAVVAIVVMGCQPAPTRTLPHVPEGADERPTEVLVVYPEVGQHRALVLSQSRDEWSGLSTEALSLRDPRAHPQPRISVKFREAGDRALEDWVEPLAGVTVITADDAVPGRDCRTLVVVEILPGALIQEMHGSDAFTESFYELDTFGIRRAIIRMPAWLLDETPDDFANFLQHEFGHALGLEGHLEEGLDLVGETWFWDRLMTVPTPIGQRWQPATSEDIAALAAGRYRLRPGWIDHRRSRYADVIPYRSTPLRVASR